MSWITPVTRLGSSSISLISIFLWPVSLKEIHLWNNQIEVFWPMLYFKCKPFAHAESKGSTNTAPQDSVEHLWLHCISKALNSYLKRDSNQSKPVLRRCIAWSILGITCLLKAGCQGLARHATWEEAEDAGQPSLCGQQKCLKELQVPISSFRRGRGALSPLSKQSCRHCWQQGPFLLRTHPWSRSWVHGHTWSFPFQGTLMALWASGSSISWASQH